MATLGKGTLFNRWDGSQWVLIANIVGIDGPSASRETVDTTTLNSTGGYREFIGSLRDAGEISLNMNFDKDTFAIMQADLDSDDSQEYQIVLPDSVNTTIEFTGLITANPVSIQVDDKISSDVTIKLTGDYDLTTVKVIKSVATLSNITGLAAGDATQLADAGLPSTVTVTYTDYTTASLEVTWDAATPQWDGASVGTYVFTGTITCATGIINPDAVKASQSVVVSA